MPPDEGRNPIMIASSELKESSLNKVLATLHNQSWEGSTLHIQASTRKILHHFARFSGPLSQQLVSDSVLTLSNFWANSYYQKNEILVTSLAKQLFSYAIFSFALTEAIASFAPIWPFWSHLCSPKTHVLANEWDHFSSHQHHWNFS